jgi:hypothetical protein
MAGMISVVEQIVELHRAFAAVLPATVEFVEVGLKQIKRDGLTRP